MIARFPTLLPFLAAAGVLHADVTFNFDYSGSAEFNDPTLGAARRAALEDAAEWLGAYFVNDATLDIEVISFTDSGSPFLAGAGSFPTPVTVNFTGFIGQIAERKVLEGIDGNGSGFGTNPDGSPKADGCVDINFAVPWDLDDVVAPGSFDFKGTVIHELMHVFGFLSSIFEDGTDIYETPPGTAGVWVPFDEYITDVAGAPVIDASFILDQTAWDTHKVGGASPASGLFFRGPNAMAANNGNPVGLYTPTTWQEGSSVSHLDDDDSVYDGSLMLAGLSPGPAIRQLSLVEIAMLEDLGYTMKGFDLSLSRSGGDVTLTVKGPPGSWLVSRSSNLSGWSLLGNVFIDPPATSAPIGVLNPLDTEFFRVGGASTGSIPPPSPPEAPGPPTPPRWRR